MNNNRISDLQKELEQMSREQLERLLHTEIAKDMPDGDVVRLTLKILEKRMPPVPEACDAELDVVWAAHEARRGQLQQAEIKKRPASASRWFLRVASVVVILGVLMLVIPQDVKADSFFEMIARWTDSVFEFFRPGDDDAEEAEYVFRTDHPGLQQVYDAVTELGVTDPVVPMWLPDGYELTELKIEDSPMKTRLLAFFKSESNTIILEVNIYSNEQPNRYYKDEEGVITHEYDSITHYVITNDEIVTAVWTRDNIESSVSVDCQEDTLYDILDSIYTTEDD